MDPNSTNNVVQRTKRTLKLVASFAASAMLACTLIKDFLPYEIHSYFSSATNALCAHLSTQHTIIIRERAEYSTNQLFHTAETYIATKIPISLTRLLVNKPYYMPITFSFEPGKEMVDVFEGVHIRWLFLIDNSHSSGDKDESTIRRFIELTFHHKHKQMVLSSYLPYILNMVDAIVAQKRTLSLHLNNGDCWTTIDLHNPATFSTLAMEPKVRQYLMDDLERFVKRKDYYSRIGKAWKRGYLLYGPPGSGKSSLVAAMANYLKFNIYSLDLSEVRNNKSLQNLLLKVRSKSILVAEDIDCSIDLTNREDENDKSAEKVTLSGLLNAVDGLWSCCGQERIIVFTTNYKDRLDSALLRPGRMDVHIPMGYCGVPAFRTLAANFHGVDVNHPLFEEIEELIEEVKVTPAEVAEQLMRSEDPQIALKCFIEFIQEKRPESRLV